MCKALDIMTDLDKPYSEKHKERCVDILHRYIDYLSKKGFFGQMTISWEKGKPIVVKQNSTLNFEDIEKMIPRI